MEPPGLLAEVFPDQWNNIPIPLVDAMKHVISEITRLAHLQREDFKRTHVLDRRELEHNTAALKELGRTEEKLKKEIRHNREETK